MIKSRKLKVIVSSCFAVGVAVGLYLATAELPTTHAQQGLDGRAFAAERTHEIGIQAYVYSYPMIMMEITRRVSTNVKEPRGAPMNQFGHLRAFPDHTFKEVVRPNADTLYSIAWFDISKEPQVLSVGLDGFVVHRAHGTS